MEEKYEILRHFLAALAYRTQKALRDAPDSFYDFRMAENVRTPLELIRHMESVLGYDRTAFEGGSYQQIPLPGYSAEIQRFHQTLQDLTDHLEKKSPILSTTPERLLQGPFADAMTHAGQLAMLRRLAGSPIPPENFMLADIKANNVSAKQAQPVKPGNRNGEWPEGK